MPPVEEVSTEERPPASNTMTSDVQIHALRYKINTGTNEACFYIENVEETSESIKKANKRFLWQSQKWVVYIYDVAELPIQRRRNRLILREIRRRSRRPNEGKDFEVTEIVTVDENEAVGENEMSSTLREYIWKPKNVNKNESYVLVVYVDEGENPDEILGKPSSYSMNTSAMDFEISFDDFLDSLNDPTEEKPQGALAKLTYVSEKLIHVKQETDDESENEEFYEIEPINIKLLYEQPITWVNPYEGKYGLSTSHFQLSERFGDSLESKLLKVTTRGGYLSDFSLSFSEVKQIKKSRDSKSQSQPTYEDIPKDTIVIDKLDRLNESEKENIYDGVDGKLSPLVLTEVDSDDEGFEEISLPIEQKPRKVEKQIQTRDDTVPRTSKVTLKQLAVPKTETDNDSVYSSESPVEETTKVQTSTPISNEKHPNPTPIILNNKSKTIPAHVRFNFNEISDFDNLKNIEKTDPVSLKPNDETVLPKTSQQNIKPYGNDQKNFDENENTRIEVKPVLILNTLKTTENPSKSHLNYLPNNRVKLQLIEEDEEAIIPETKPSECNTCDNLIDEIDQTFHRDNKIYTEIKTFDENILPPPEKSVLETQEKDRQDICQSENTKGLSPFFIEVRLTESYPAETRDDNRQTRDYLTEEEEDEISPVDKPSQLWFPNLVGLESQPEPDSVSEIKDEILRNEKQDLGEFSDNTFEEQKSISDSDFDIQDQAESSDIEKEDQKILPDIEIVDQKILPYIETEDQNEITTIEIEDSKEVPNNDIKETKVITKIEIEDPKVIPNTEIKDQKKLDDFERERENSLTDSELEDEISVSDNIALFSAPELLFENKSGHDEPNALTDSLEEGADDFKMFDSDIRSSSPCFSYAVPDDENTFEKQESRLHVNASKRPDDDVIATTKQTFYLEKISYVIPAPHKTEEAKKGFQIKDEVFEEPLSGEQYSDESSVSFENLIEDDKLIEEENDFVDLNMDLSSRHNSENTFFYQEADDEKIVKRSSSLLIRRRLSRDNNNDDNDEDNAFFVIKPLKLDSVVTPSKLNNENPIDHSFEEIDEIVEENVKQCQMLEKDPFENFDNCDDVSSKHDNSKTDTDDMKYWDDEELEKYMRQNSDPGHAVGTIQYNTVIKYKPYDPTPVRKYSRQSSSNSTVSSTYNDDIQEEPEEQKPKTLKKKAKSIILKPFKRNTDQEKSQTLPVKLSSKSFSHKPKTKKRHYTDSELPIPTINQRIELLRENSSDNLLGGKTFRTSKRVQEYKAFRSQSTGSILDTIDIEKIRKEKDRKERRRRLAGYSFVNSDFNPNASVIKSREYTVDACAKEVERERYFVRQERKKASRWSNRNMSVSTDKIEKIRSLGKVNVPQTFYKPPENSKHPANGEKEKHVGKVKIPRAFSFEDLLSDQTDSQSREVLI